MARGGSLFVDGNIELRPENGALSFYARSGEVITPAELVKRKYGKGAVQ